MSALLAKVFSLRALTADREGHHVLFGERVFLMTSSQARRYRELKRIESGFSLLTDAVSGEDSV